MKLPQLRFLAVLGMTWLFGGSVLLAQSPPGCPSHTPATLPLSENFNSFTGSLTGDSIVGCSGSSYWQFADAGTSGELLFGVPSAASGPGADFQGTSVAMSSVSSSDSVLFTWTVNMSGYNHAGSSDFRLEFVYADLADEDDNADQVYLRGSPADSWIPIFDWNDANTGNWESVSIALDSFLTAQGQSFSDSTQIAWGQEDNAAVTGGDGLALDDVSLTAFSCAAPSLDSISGITTTSADIAFTSGGGTTQLAYAPAGAFSPDTVNQLTLGSGPYTLSGLTAATDYEFYLRDSCSATDSSFWAGPYAFSTACGIFNAPYSLDFESTSAGDLPNCWSSYANYSGASAEVAAPSSFSAIQPLSGSQLLELDNSSGGAINDTLMAISPRLGDLTAGDKQLLFEAATEELTNTLVVATVASDQAPYNLTVIDTVNFSAVDTWASKRVIISAANGYNGTDEYLVLLHGQSSSFESLFIEDLRYETAPACLAPLGFQAVATGSDSLVVSTTDGFSSFEVEWGPCGYNQGTGTLASTSSGSLTVTGLNGNTCYDFYVRQDCGGNGNSAWAGPFDFTTLCNPDSLPSAQNFDSWPLSCWQVDLGSVAWQEYAGTGGDNSAEATFWTNNNDTMVMQSTLIHLGQNARLVFDWSHLYSTTYPGDRLLVMALASGSGMVDTLFDRSGSNLNDPTASNTSPGNYITEYLPISPSLTGQTVQIIFKAFSDWGPDLFVDNAIVEAKPNCPNPTQLVAVNDSITAQSAYLYWTSGGAAYSQVEWGPAGYTPGSAATLGDTLVTDTFATVNGLSANTAYDFYVRDSCASQNAYSPYQGPLSVTTACAALVPTTLALNDGFENYSGPITTTENFRCGPNYNWRFENVSGSGTLAFADSADAGPALPTSGSSSAALTSESSTAPVYLILTANLSNFANSASGIKLSYRLADHYWLAPSPSNAGNNVWVRGSKSDPWILVKDWTTLNASSAAVPDSFFLDAVLQASGQSLSATTQVRWGQQTAYGLTGGFTAGGMSLDDVRLEEVTCPAPQNLRGIASIDTSAQLAWNDAGSAGSYQLWVGTAGFYQGSQTVGGYKTVTSADSLQLDTLTGSTCYEFLVRSICGPGDTSLWSGPQTFCTPCSPAVAPYTESFDQNGVPGCWASSEITGDGWQYGQLGDAGYAAANAQERTGNGGYYAWVDFSGTDEGTVLESQIVDVSSLTTPGLSFELYSNNTDDNATNILFVEAWDGSQWLQVDSIRGNFGGWTFQFANLSTFTYGANNGLVKLRLWAESGGSTTDYYNDLLVDEFTIDEFISCPPPTNLALVPGSLRIDSAMVSWTTGGASNWRVSYGPAGTPAGGGTVISAGNDTLALNGLSSGTEYVVYVQDSCGPGDVSPWVGPFSFVTPYGTNFLETFDNSSYDNLGWREASNPLNTTLSYSSSGWAFEDFTNRSSRGTAVASNIFSSDEYDWLISPSIYLDPAKANLQVEFDAAITEWSDTLQGYLGSDDSLAVVISTDNGQTWSDNNILWVATSQDTVDGQGEHIVAPLTGYSGYVRFGLYASSGPNNDPEDNDLFIENFEVRTPPACANPTNLSARNVTTSGATVQWTPADSNGLGWQVILTTGNQAPGNGTVYTASANDSIALIGLMSATTYCAYVVEQCSAGFSDTTGPVCFTTQCTSFNLPFSQNFDGNSWVADDQDFSAASSQIGNCWTRMPDNGNDYSWRVRSTSTGSGSTGPDTDATGGNFIYAEASDGSSGDTANLTSPVINLGNATNPSLVYGYHFYGGDIDRMLVEVYDGNSWNLENTRVGADQTSSSAAFKYDTVDLSSYSGNIQVRFRSVRGNSFAGDLALDSVIIKDATCPAPDSLALASVNCDTATIAWNSQSGGSILQYGPAGFTPGTGSFTGVVTSPYSLSGLPLDTDYDVWVADTCGGDTTAYAGPFSFSTDSVGPVNAAFTYQVLSVTDSNARVAFDASGATNAQSYQWSFGGGAMMDTISYTTNGNKSVTLTVTGRCGATDDTTLTFSLSGIDLREWGTAALSVYPNPARESVKVSVSGYGSPYTVQLSDSRGSVVLERSDLQPGTPHELSLKDLSPGVYIIKLQGTDLRQTSRLMVR
jgi:hypothetical protein